MQEVPDSTSSTSSPSDDTKSSTWIAAGSSVASDADSSNTAAKQSNTDDDEDAVTVMRRDWDPLRCAEWDMQPATVTCIARLKSDIVSINKDPPPGIFISPDPDNLTKIRALIVGPSDTPYEGGFFYFAIRCPPDYPIRPPRCRLLTTGNNTVRFNPNLYANGKVCLSILGTWSGPAWSPAQCLSSLLLSIQSLMSEYPYQNEPGFEEERGSGDAKAYNEIIRHETIRAAVCDMLENSKSCPSQLYEIIEREFPKFYDFYVKVCTENISRDGQTMVDPFHATRGCFQYSSILRRLNTLKVELAAKPSTSDRQEQSADSRTQKILNEASLFNSDLPASSNGDLDDIFDDDDYDEDDDDDDDDDQME